jgi:hypothetical protein
LEANAAFWALTRLLHKSLSNARPIAGRQHRANETISLYNAAIKTPLPQPNAGP